MPWWTTVLSYVLLALALSVVGWSFRDRFRSDYGIERGPLMLLLFVFCWPLFVAESIRNRDWRRKAPKDL